MNWLSSVVLLQGYLVALDGLAKPEPPVDVYKHGN